jgi:PEP-CTERM motif-containing protein
MNIKYAALLCGFVMIAAVPVMADRMSDYRSSNDSDYAGIHTVLNHVADLRDATPSLALVTVYTSSSDGDAHSVKLNDFGSFGHAYSNSDSEKAWGKERDRARDGDNGKDHAKAGAPVAVPEPGSLSLLMIGLAGIGVVAFRRGAKQRAVSTVGGF